MLVLWSHAWVFKIILKVQPNLFIYIHNQSIENQPKDMVADQ